MNTCKATIKQAEPNSTYEINGQCYDVNEVVETPRGSTLPIVNIKMQSDYDWQKGCLKGRLQDPEGYRQYVKENVEEKIERLYNWLIENENIENGDIFDEELKQMYRDYKNMISETQDIFTSFEHMTLGKIMQSNIQSLKRRLRFEGYTDNFSKEVAIYQQGYIDGIRKERARRKKSTNEVICV